MSATFTQGQWAIDWNVSRLDIHSGGKLIATLRRSTKDGAPTFDDAEAIANANLIAAAPELLEALQPFVERNSSDEFVTIRVRTADIAAARSAIAKALGDTSCR